MAMRPEELRLLAYAIRFRHGDTWHAYGKDSKIVTAIRGLENQGLIDRDKERRTFRLRTDYTSAAPVYTQPEGTPK